MVNSRKDWNDIKSNDSWSIFKIMSEFVEGFDRMSKIGPCVSIFGSARTPEENPHYKLGVDLAEQLSKRGYGIIIWSIWRTSRKSESHSYFPVIF